MVRRNPLTFLEHVVVFAFLSEMNAATTGRSPVSFLSALAYARQQSASEADQHLGEDLADLISYLNYDRFVLNDMGIHAALDALDKINFTNWRVKSFRSHRVAT